MSNGLKLLCLCAQYNYAYKYFPFPLIKNDITFFGIFYSWFVIVIQSNEDNDSNVCKCGHVPMLLMFGQISSNLADIVAFIDGDFCFLF